VPPGLRLIALAALVAVIIVPFAGARSPGPDDAPLPERPVAIEVDMQERATYRLAVPDVKGGEGARTVTDVLRHDMRVSGEVAVVPESALPRGAADEGLDVRRKLWTDAGVQGVIKGSLTSQGDRHTLELRFYEVGRRDGASLTETYRGTTDQLRDFAHRFDNEVLRVLTGKAGAFDTEITFAKRLGPGRKDVMVMDYDGARRRRISPADGVSLLPSFGARGVWYSRLTSFGMFITNAAAKAAPVIESDGLNMGAAECNNRVYFTSTRDGNSEIYSAALDGSDVKRLTDHPSIDVSPTCGPRGEIAFVSSRQGSPQIFLMSADGSNPRRVTYKGSHNQTPAFCPDASRSLLAFTGRDGGLDIFTLDLQTKVYTRLTQAQGVNKDPTFSPDCRMVAFHSSRGGGGIWLTNPDGFNQNRVYEGHAETLRWSRR
jgi:TolB protein